MFHQKKKSRPAPPKRQEKRMNPKPPSSCTSHSQAFPINTIAIRTVRYLEEKVLCYQHNSVSRTRKKTEATTQWKKNQTIFAQWISFIHFISIIYTKKDPLDTITRAQKRQRGFDKTQSSDPKKSSKISPIPSPNYTFNSTFSLSNRFSVFEDEDCVDENCVDGVNDVMDVPVLNSLPNNQFLNIDAAFQITFHLR